MNSTVTIDGQTYGFPDATQAAAVWEAATGIVRHGKSHPILMSAVDGDVRRRTLVHVTPSSTISAVLDYNPAEEIPPNLVEDNIMKVFREVQAMDDARDAAG